MAVTFEAVAGGSNAFSATVTVAIDAGTNADRCIVAFAATDRSGSTLINGATFAGNVMNGGTSFTDAAGRRGRVFWIDGASVPSGTSNCVVTLSDGNTRPSVIVAAYSGAGGGPTVSGEATGSGTNTNATWSVTSVSGDLVFALWVASGSATATPGTGTTMRANDTLADQLRLNAMDEAGDTSVTINATWTGSREWLGVAGSIAVSGSGTIDRPKTRLLIGVG